MKKPLVVAFPESIVDYLQSVYLLPVYLCINDQGHLLDYYGELEDYGLDRLRKNQDVMPHLSFLEGLLPITQVEVLEFIHLNNQVVHVHIVPDLNTTWVLFLNASFEFQRHQEIQQQYNDLSLLTYRKNQLLKKVQHQANYDHLTDLSNRNLFTERLNYALKQAKRRHSYLALFFIDLDGFKRVNDTLGHDAGDRLLCDVAQQLQDHLRESDSIARIGGDEFTVLLTQEHHCASIDVVANKILKLLHLSPPERPDLSISASIGVACYPHHAHSRECLIKHADDAMYQAKQAGGNQFVIFSPQRGEL